MSYLIKLNILFIDLNFWNCDCNLRWLREKMDYVFYVIQDLYLIVCSGLLKVVGKVWDELKLLDFVCNEE